MATRSSGSSDAFSPEMNRRLDDLRLGLLGVHKALLGHERILYERQHGHVPGSGDFLQLVIHDPWFEWIRPLSELIVRIDETLAATDPPPEPEDAERLIAAARALLRPDEQGLPFQRKYFRAIQDSPEVAMTHATWKRLGGQPQRK